jgi:hypothetical protein
VGGDAQTSSDLGQRLADSLSRFGVAGDVIVDAGRATLHGSGPTVTVDVAPLLDDWRGLSEELRQRRVNDVARRLAGERRAVVGSSMPAPGVRVSGLLAKLGIGLAVLVVGFGIRVSYRQWAAMHPDTDKPKPLIADYDAYERQRAERAAHVCEATRSRVMRGATVGPSDVEGWVVELWALRSASKPSLAGDPTLATFVSMPVSQTKGRIVWPNAAPSLASAQGPATEVAVIESNLPETGEPFLRGVRLVMSGHYVVPYFNEPERLDYLRFARVLTDALGADYAGLYARCARSTSHQLGSWFRGPTSGGSLASLLFFMGVFAEHPDLRLSVLAQAGASNVDPAFALKNLISAATPVKKTRVMELVGADNGMISGTDDRVSTITFPFKDGNRAGRASHVAARELGIGEGR